MSEENLGMENLKQYIEGLKKDLQTAIDGEAAVPEDFNLRNNLRALESLKSLQDDILEDGSKLYAAGKLAGAYEMMEKAVHTRLPLRSLLARLATEKLLAGGAIELFRDETPGVWRVQAIDYTPTKRSHQFTANGDIYSTAWDAIVAGITKGYR